MPSTMLAAKAMRVYVSTTEEGEPVLVGLMQGFEKTSEQQVQSYDVFEAVVAQQFPGAKTVSVALSGAISIDDPGQEILRDAEAADAVIYATIRPNGTKGYKVPVKVTSGGHSASATGIVQETDYTLLFQEAPVAEASGGYVI